MSVADEPQRSLLAIGGLLNERNKDDHGLLGGSHRPHGSGRAMTILGRGWSTFTTKDVHDRLEWLVHEGHRARTGADHQIVGAQTCHVVERSARPRIATRSSDLLGREV